MRNRVFTTFTVILLIFSLPSTAAYASKNPAAGAKCSKVKATQVFQGKLFTCIKSKNKLVWNKGVVIKAAAASPKASPSASASASTSPSPSASPTQNLLTMEKVRANNTPSSCWTVIDGYVYDLTKWINSHPGGPSAIRGLCGTDGTKSFKSQHESEAQAAQRLSLYLLGPLNG